jgi:hypothetical protein
MTTYNDPQFIPFLLRAKQNTYAAKAGQVASSRPQSHDLAYQEGDWYYYDTYLGGFAFSGEEAVWNAGVPVWAMNYYGSMIGIASPQEVPDGFGDFLKHALMAVPAEAPYRGPKHFAEDRFTFTCRWNGDPTRFDGEEEIAYDGKIIYHLHFHGGLIL